MTTDVERAIAYIEECRMTHVRWADYLRSDADLAADPEPQGPVGGAEVHDEWVEKYDHVLSVLRQTKRPPALSTAERKRRNPVPLIERMYATEEHA